MSVRQLIFFPLFLFLSGCGVFNLPPSGQASLFASSNVLVSWNANRESAVNRQGGGYIVYYSSVSGKELVGKSVKVPFVSGASSPASAQLSGLTSGTWYLKVVAYSALNPPGNSGGSRSGPSQEITVKVP